MADLVEVLKSLYVKLVNRQRQCKRLGDEGPKYCRDRRAVQSDPKNREQIKALKKKYETGWKQAADELSYFEDLFDDAVEWCADETGFQQKLIAKAAAADFHASRLKPVDLEYYEGVCLLVSALRNLPPDKWKTMAWAQSSLTPKPRSVPISKQEQQVTTPRDKLNELDREVLLALGDLKAIAKDCRAKADEVAAKISVGKDRFYVKESLAKLTKPDFGYVASHQGRNGGSWLTSTGRRWFNRQRR
jgi:hypothetical protein